MRSFLIALITIGVWSCKNHTGVLQPPATDIRIPQRISHLSESELQKLDSLDIDFQFRGNCYAYSSDKNKQISNGEAHSDNLPQKTDSTFARQGLYLVINPNEQTAIDSMFLGCKLYLVNTTDEQITLDASDSRLYIIAEGLDKNKQWNPISYLPSSSCGNSYHKVILDKDEYWSFDIPVFKGAFETRIRYTLIIDGTTRIHSNEIVAHLNKDQFNKKRKQGHTNTNIMDPYYE